MHTERLILYFVYFIFTLFYFTLCYFILLYFTLFYFILLYFTLFYYFVLLYLQKQATDQLLISDIETSQTICDEVTELAFRIISFSTDTYSKHFFLVFLLDRKETQICKCERFKSLSPFLKSRLKSDKS